MAQQGAAVKSQQSDDKKTGDKDFAGSGVEGKKDEDGPKEEGAAPEGAEESEQSADVAPAEEATAASGEEAAELPFPSEDEMRSYISSMPTELRELLRTILNDFDAADGTAPAASFDKTGASSCIQMRHGKPMRIWFREGKEIGVENAGE